MITLLCTNEDCVAHGRDEQRFTVQVLVDENGKILDNFEELEDKNFRCCFCHEHTAMKFIPLEEPAND